MAVACPEWLTQRGGVLKLASDGQTWFVMLNQQPHYALIAVPAAGKFGCAIRQTSNGQRVASNVIFATPDEALRGGLEDLRKSLGW